MVKDSGMRIRVERGLREAFLRACRAQNRPAADLLREFMESCVNRFESGQGELFSEPSLQATKRKQANEPHH